MCWVIELEVLVFLLLRDQELALCGLCELVELFLVLALPDVH